MGYCGLYAEDCPFTPLNQFVKNMNSNVRELKRFDVPIVYATTKSVRVKQIKAVAVPGVSATSEMATVFRQDNNRIRQYNEVIVVEFKRQGVIIKDI